MGREKVEGVGSKRNGRKNWISNRDDNIRHCGPELIKYFVEN